MPDPAPQPAAAARWAEADRLFAERNLDEAEAIYRELTATPSHASLALVRLSMIAAMRGRPREEAEAALAAFKARIPVPPVLQIVGSRLRGAGETRGMLACAIDPVVVDCGDARVYAEFGRELTSAHFPIEALELLERARTGGYTSPVLRFMIGLCRLYLGQDDKARAEFEDTLRRQPHHAPSLHALTRLRLPVSEGDGQVERLREAIAATSPDDDFAPMLHYALFEELDRRDRQDEAWEALSEGMRLQQARLAYDSSADQELFDHLATVRAPAPAATGAEGPRPVFIVGLPGSGTSLLERILGHHEDVADCGELPDFLQQLRWCADLGGPAGLDLALAKKAEEIDFDELGTRYLAHTWWRGGDRKVYTDRTPANFLAISYILRALPHARVLHMVRSPMDTCFAGLSQWLGRMHPYSYDQQDMAAHFRRYRSLAAHWRAQYPDRVMDVRYEELVENPEAVIKDVLEFCDLPQQDGITDIEGWRGAPAASSDNQRPEAIHDGYVDRWRRYEKQLATLKEKLGALAY